MNATARNAPAEAKPYLVHVKRRALRWQLAVQRVVNDRAGRGVGDGYADPGIPPPPVEPLKNWCGPTRCWITPPPASARWRKLCFVQSRAARQRMTA